MRYSSFRDTLLLELYTLVNSMIRQKNIVLQSNVVVYGFIILHLAVNANDNTVTNKHNLAEAASLTYFSLAKCM
jgi:hypothetical protein